MKPICLILAVVVLSNAQKSQRAGPHHGGRVEAKSAETGAYSESSPSHKQYSQHGGNGGGGHHYQQPASYGGAAAKATYPLILQDQRQINHDGSINFNYAADNGLQQGETVDPDGTRRGFYSYVGADGKPLTVKYTAGKNGFVAEGDHLPRQPNVAAQTKDEVVTKGHGHDGGNQYQGPRGGSGHYQGGPSAGAYYGGAPSHYSANAGSPGPSPYSQYNNNGGGHGRGHYNPAPSPYHDRPAGPSSFSFGAGDDGPSYNGGGGGGHHSGRYQSAPQTQYSHSLPSHGGFGGHGRGQNLGSASMHSALNPYTPVGPAGAYQGAFDLGNGGHYSIDFSPGSAQEVSYGAGGSPSGHQGGGGGGGGPSQHQRY